jgi:diguanylate cyclase (GGDEF)-like protein
MENRTQATGLYQTQYSKNSEYISGYIEKLISYNYSMSSSVLEDASAKVGIFKIINVVSFLLLFLIMGILFRMTFHNVIAPIQKLAKQSQQIANYNFDVQDITVTTNDEMAELVKMFNHMREKLKLMFDSNIKNLQMAEELLVQIQGDENLAELVQSQKNLNEEMFKEANIDHLTHLMNQNAFIHCVNENIKSISRSDLCALFVIDVDNFTSINATLGEGAEEVLKYSASELNNLFRDCGFIARWDKDVFVGYISGLPNVEFVHQKCKDINSVMSIRFRHKKKYHPVTASVGVYLCTNPVSAEVMFEKADRELQSVKDAGKNGYHISNINV